MRGGPASILFEVSTASSTTITVTTLQKRSMPTVPLRLSKHYRTAIINFFSFHLRIGSRNVEFI